MYTSSELLSIDSCDSDAMFDFEDDTLNHNNSSHGMQEYHDAATSPPESDSHSVVSSSSSESELNDLSGEEIWEDSESEDEQGTRQSGTVSNTVQRI